MKHKMLFILLFLLSLGICPYAAYAKNAEETMTFDYENEELIDVVNTVAEKKGVNIVPPMGANAITSKVNIFIKDPITVDQAWNLLVTTLDIAGYSVTGKNIRSIAKNNKAVSREVLPLYVGSDPDKLPDNDDRIRFLYYLTNIRVTDDPNSEVAAILKELLPADTTSFQFDTRANALLITDKANNIKSVSKIIAMLDHLTFQEKIEIIKLRYVNADIVSKLFMENILRVSPDANKARIKGKRGESNYFSENIKMIPEPRANQLIILGKEQAVERAKEFIYKYIDVEMESGESILHVYQLLYLDAISFEPVLRSIVESEKAGGTGQSAAGGPKTGVERFFEGVIIKADQPRVGVGKNQVYGSNKLIIAAKNEDWKHIKRLIEQLDKPQAQVIIEVLVADLTFDDLRQLGTQTRNPAALPLPGNMSIQSAQIGPVVLSSAPPPPASLPTVATDLLGNVFPVPGLGNVSLASLRGENDPGFPGSTLISVSDGNNGSTWTLLQLLQQFQHSKILSQPHIIATNNKEALVKIGEERLVEGETINTAAAPTIQRVKLDANLTVRITPRISSANDVTLNVNIAVREFTSPQIVNNTIITRTIETNAAIQSGDILALGGLIRTRSENAANETPLLGKIPILGWLFKKRKGRNQKTNLTVFISPTIVQPRLRGGVNEYTKDYIGLTQKYAQESQLFDSLRDPITRFFFRSQQESLANRAIDTFVAKDEFKRDVIIEPPPKEINIAAGTQQHKPAGPGIDKTHTKKTLVAHMDCDDLREKLAGIKNPF